jgi:ATP-dependent RNA helicase DeaD
VALSGEYSQNERTHALHSLRSGQARVCVATDVAARGIDLPGLDLVIHAELPNDRDTLLHRSGRTGRAGRKGMSIVLVPFNRRRKAEMLLERARIEAQWGTPPAPEDIRHADLERMKNDPIFTSAATPEEDDFISHIMSAHQPHDIASAFVRLYRTRLPAAEDLCIMPLNAKAGKGEQRPREIGTNDKGRRERFERRDSHFDKGHSQTPMQWFRMNVGRQSNADPKWIIPLICRLGHITKKDIGLIKIFDHETKFEIAQSIAGAFNAHIRRADDKEAMNIKPIGAEGHTNASTAHPHKHKHKGLKGADHKDKTQRKDKASPAHKDKQRHKDKTKAKHGGKTQTGGHETAPNTKAPNTKAPKTKKHKARD